MRKFIFMAAVCAAMISFNMNARTDKETKVTKFFDNTYIGVNGGMTFGLHGHPWLYEDVAHSIKPVASLRLGKWVTPSVGFELQGEAGFGTFNTTTVVDHSTVGANVLFNLNNLILGYSGTPKRVEVVPFIGLGWWHSYGDIAGMYVFRMDAVSNWLYGRTGAQLNINLGKNRAWQFNVIPSITYLISSNSARVIQGQSEFIRGGLNSNRAYINIEVGFTYKFKNGQGSHNFVLSDKEYTLAECNAKINEALAKQTPQERIVEKVVTNEVTKTVETAVEKTYIVAFAQGSAELSNDAKATLDAIKGSVKIKAYASPEGGKKRNDALSEERADVIKSYLENNGVRVLSAEGLGVNGKTSNRIAIVTVE